MAAAISLGVAIPDGANAQEATSAPSCLDQAVTADSVNTVLHLSLDTWRSVRERERSPRLSVAEREALAFVLQEVRAAVMLPLELTIAQTSRTSFAVVGDSTRSPQLLHPEVAAAIAFTLHVDGHVSALALERPSISAALDSALVASLRREGSTGLLWNLVGPLGRDSVRLLLTTTHRADARRVTTPLVAMRLPVYFGVPVVSRGTAFPDYPEAAYKARRTGTVIMQFVVDTLGRVESGSEQVLEATSGEFVLEVRRVLSHLRYRPMRVGGCAVSKREQQPFVFSLH